MLPTDPLPPAEKPVSPADLVRFGFGVLLLMLGLGLGGWVVWQVMRFLNDPSAFTSFQELILPSAERPEVFLLPREVWLYGLPLALISMVAGFANALIMGGVNLLSGNFERLQRTLTQKMNELLTAFQQVIDQLNKPRS